VPAGRRAFPHPCPSRLRLRPPPRRGRTGPSRAPRLLTLPRPPPRAIILPGALTAAALAGPHHGRHARTRHARRSLLKGVFAGGHPCADQLQALGSGRLSGEAAAALREHLGRCPACNAEALRLADTIVRPEAPLDGARTLKAGRIVPPAPAIPPELRDHPQYDVVRELGRGGMGVVSLATNRLMQRPEVLKVMSKALLHAPDAAERFLREIRSAAQLSHPNVVTAYSALQVGESLVFAMEYVDGEPLSAVVRRRGPLPVANACYYAYQAALGLQHAFEKGMVHRDIKPQNLILARTGKRHVVKVLDFGLAKATTETGFARELTAEGDVLGTPDYMAPEQWQNARGLDIRADVYSLGCTLYFLLTGTAPFGGNTAYELLAAHVLKEAPPLGEVRPDVPPELAAVVARMIAKDPARRYQQPAEVARALTPFLKAAGRATAKAAVPGEPAEAQSCPPEPGHTEVIGLAPEEPAAEPADRGEPASAEPTAVLSAKRRSKAGRARRQRRSRRAAWLVGAGLGACVLLVGIVGLTWKAAAAKRAPGVGMGSVTLGTGWLVLEVNEAFPIVVVDGEEVAVPWAESGRKAELAVKAGRHWVEFHKMEFLPYREEVTVEDNARRTVTGQLRRPFAPPPHWGAPPFPPPEKGGPPPEKGGPPPLPYGRGR
jgi:Protein kinase domain